MSASVDQRTKGQSNQVSNGPPKEPMKEEFDGYITQPPQVGVYGAYGSAPMSSPSVSDPTYMQSYYPSMSFPYLGQTGLNEGAWSSGGDPMSFLGSYGQMGNDYMSNSGMFSGFSYQQPGFAWEFPGGDYNTWGTNSSQQPQQAQGRKTDERAQYSADGYYAPMGHDGYGGAMNGEPERDMKVMEQSMKGMSIAGDKINDNQGKEMHHGQMVNEAGAQVGTSGGSSSGAPPPKKTWASIASQPAKPQNLRPKAIPRAPVLPNKHNMDIGTWDNKNNSGKGSGGAGQQRGTWAAPRVRSSGSNSYSGGVTNGTTNGTGSGPSSNSAPNPSHPVLDKLKSANQYNPKEFNMNPKAARYFIIKSYSEDDIHRSIKYSIWCSTEHGNKRLDAAYREREGKGPIYLFYSVNGSGHFCGMAQMMSPIDYHSSSSVWAQDKWKGQFEVKWIYVKDVPNSQLRHIRLENNENKPVTNSRDTQEVPPEKGKQVLKILHNYRHTTSIFDDFVHYEKRQEEDQVMETYSNNSNGNGGGNGNGNGKRERGERSHQSRGDRMDEGEGRDRREGREREGRERGEGRDRRRNNNQNGN